MPFDELNQSSHSLVSQLVNYLAVTIHAPTIALHDVHAPENATREP